MRIDRHTPRYRLIDGLAAAIFVAGLFSALWAHATAAGVLVGVAKTLAATALFLWLAQQPAAVPLEETKA